MADLQIQQTVRLLRTLPVGIYDPTTDSSDMNGRHRMHENPLNHA